MKHLFIILLSIMSLTTYSQNKDIKCYNFKTYISNFDCGIDLGIGNETEFMYGIDVSLYGVYFDILFNPAQHINDMRVDKWKDSRSRAFHVGYKIPINKHFNIILLIGTYKYETGITDGANYYFYNNGYNVNVYNHFSTCTSFNDTDFGGKCEYMNNFTKNGINMGIRLGIAITKYTKYVNLSYGVYF